MGFLQNDTNSVGIDAVLTELGRHFIAKNDGSFSIVKFAPGDDGIDYSLIQKFGRTLGVLKIEQNTPVSEALCNGAFAQKYRLVSASNPNLIRLPKLSLSGEGVNTSGTLVSIGNTSIKRRTLTVTQTLQEGSVIDLELRDQSFSVQIDNRFLQIISSGGADNIDRNQKATYIITRDSGETSLGGSRLTLQIATKSILESQFQTYGARSNQDLINTYVKVTGMQSGSVVEFQVQINKTS